MTRLLKSPTVPGLATHCGGAIRVVTGDGGGRVQEEGRQNG